MDIKVTKTEYQQMAQKASPNSKVLRNCVVAFLIGGAICTLGQALTTLFLSFELPEKTATAMEFKSEGYVMGIGAKMFSIAGPVLVYGTCASIIYGLIIFLFKMY